MNNEVKTIKPFRNFCITIGALPTAYLESMSYYEMLCWLCKYLENTINPAINQNAEALKELQDYVSNYFDNLDVQEEINNKLDDMAQSGELAEIISLFLNTNNLLIFKTKSEMKSSEILQDGSTCKTLGASNYLDGYGESYLIREKTNEDVIDEDNIVALNTTDELIAEKIPYYLENQAITINGNIAKITGSVTLLYEEGEQDKKSFDKLLELSYPAGYNRNNCVILSATTCGYVGGDQYGGTVYPTVYKTKGDDDDVTEVSPSDVDIGFVGAGGMFGSGIRYGLLENKIDLLLCGFPNEVSINNAVCYVEVVLMKIS